MYVDMYVCRYVCMYVDIGLGAKESFLWISFAWINGQNFKKVDSKFISILLYKSLFR
jgi:hypothetical protein